MRLQSVQKLRKFECIGDRCVPSCYLFDVEGRPHQGDLLRPAPPPFVARHRFEVKWFLGFEYGAEARYNIEGTNAQLQVTMKTSTFSNDSTCRILHAPIGSCTAGGLTITYR